MTAKRPLRWFTALFLVIAVSAAAALTLKEHGTVLEKAREKVKAYADEDIFTMHGKIDEANKIDGEKQWLYNGDRDRNCEVCQMLSLTLTTKVGEKRKTSSKNSGDIIVNEILSSADTDICSFSVWKELAEKTYNMYVYDMTATCKVMLGEIEEDLESLLPKTISAEALSEKVCVKYKYCDGVKDTSFRSLWKVPEEVPYNRPLRASRNLELADVFVKYNKKRPNVVETSSGLQYKVIPSSSSPSSSAEPLCPSSLESKVSVDYMGFLLNGEEFDSSYSRNEPSQFLLNAVIKGWGEGLLELCEGEEMALYVPPSLGYGEAGAGKVITPNSLLIFYLRLVQVLEGGVTREELAKIKIQKDDKTEKEDDNKENREREEL